MLELVSEHNFWGVEYSWLAVDNAGHIGFFCTAGAGPVPLICVKNEELFEDAYELIEAQLKSSETVQVRGFDVSTSMWSTVASRGIYAFDWNEEQNKYVQIYYPKTPKKILDIENVFRNEIVNIKIDCDLQSGRGMEQMILY
jgi:hypothetical protein